MNVIERVSLQDQIAEVHREIEMRKQVYMKRIDQGRMTPEEAEMRTLNMAAVLRTLERVRDLPLAFDVMMRAKNEIN